MVQKQPDPALMPDNSLLSILVTAIEPTTRHKCYSRNSHQRFHYLWM